MHATRSSLLRSALAASFALVAGLLGACDDGDLEARSGRIHAAEQVAEQIADFDAGDDETPRAIGEVLVGCSLDADGDTCDGATEKELNTTCYCGYVPGKGVVYVQANCAGYSTTQTCCAAACSTGEVGDGNG